MKKLILCASVFLLIVNIFTINSASAQQLSVSITVTQPISCYGGNDGSLTANATGGSAPYSYIWSTEESTSSITRLEAGYYHIVIYDSQDNSAEAEIMLRNPEKLSLEVSSYTYSNGFNVTTHFASDGIVNTNPSGGTSPYSYLWSDGGATQNRSGIHAGSYEILLTDDHGCNLRGSVFLSAPDRDDWMMNGNAGFTAGTHFIGTTDNKDLVFKTNASERLRIDRTGKIRLNGFSVMAMM